MFNLFFTFHSFERGLFLGKYKRNNKNQTKYFSTLTNEHECFGLSVTGERDIGSK